ncbi:dihydrolipoamide acetyltransferase component of pyruvate dehydrogenase complex [Sulfolobales archaeon HS-7]|nr:dihydrolipoamide acetyltransferase component of pyruvate dehydrogenase complex [Sulfolobales archaeon HS-7]
MEFKFPDVGEGITEGRIVKWLVKDGDEVKEDQPLVEVETDKAVVTLPSPGRGKIKIALQEGAEVKVGEILGVIGDELPKGGQEPERKVETRVTQSPQQEVAKEKEVIATPAVRRLARELGVDLTKVEGTGPGGKILEEDVRRFYESKKKPPIEVIKEEKVETTKPETTKEQRREVQPGAQKLPEIRLTIAKNMQKSWSIPRAVHMDIVDVTKFWEFYQIVRNKVEKLTGDKISVTSLMIKALSVALKENPQFNAMYDFDNGEVIRYPYVNMGVAVQSEDGLRVVVIKDSDKKSVVTIDRELKALVTKVKERKISVDDMRGATFTLSNPGSFGSGLLSVPMINYPNVAILATGPIRDMPWVINGEIKIAKVLPYSISFDHRAVDGADAIKLGESFVKYLNEPELMVLF